MKGPAFAAAAGLAAALSACTPAPPAELPLRARRIVSLAPSVTELVFRAGAGDELAGVTRWCSFPPEARAKPVIGDLVVDCEAILMLEPDLVISAPLTSRMNGELAALGVPVAVLQLDTFAEIAGALRWIGERTGHADVAEQEARELERRVAATAARCAGRKRPRVFFEGSLDPILSTNGTTHVGHAIACAGGDSMTREDEERWPFVHWERVLLEDPDVILIAHAASGQEYRAGWADLTAVATGRAYRVPGAAYHYGTPRLLEGLTCAAECFHGRP